MNIIVIKISDFLQKYMGENNINSLTADECAKLLSDNDILSSKGHPKPGFNFRQMLRDGRDGRIGKIKGVFQERPNTRWVISRVDE